jgi:23S rRNA (cytidine1920-2'-O)/16S rRNA (cytidine1409-2'-O)-methyltransferase
VVAKERLDLLLLNRGLAPTRERAEALIRAGIVFVAEQRVDKPGTKVPIEAPIRVKDKDCPYVSRGGQKLKAALDTFQVNPENLVALDVGSSTGGFTDCLLQHGAKRVIAVDVGTNQLVYSLRVDPRVTVYEKCNFRTLPDQGPFAEIQAEKPTLMVCDVSFISLRMILPVADQILAHPAQVVTLVKPQFELPKNQVGEGGIVRDENARQSVISGMITFCEDTLGWTVLNTMDSPVHGTKGNIEFLLHATTR